MRTSPPSGVTGVESLTYSGTYPLSRWALGLLKQRPRLTSLKSDLVPFLVRRQAHPVHVPPRLHVVQGIQHQLEADEEGLAKPLAVHDVGVVRLQPRVRVEGAHRLARHHRCSF
jgi:hypothetical protein